MEGHVRKRGDKWAFWIELPKDPETGKRRQKTRSGFRTKREAQAAMTQLMAQLQAGTFVEPTRLTFAAYADQWLEQHSKRQKSPKTLETYGDFLRLHLKPALGELRLTQVTALHLDRYYAEKGESGRRDGKGGLSAQTLLHHHRLLHLMFEQARRWNLVQQNPVEAAEAPQPVKRKARILTFEQATELWEAAADTRLYMPIILGVTMAMRRGEILALKWSDVRLEKDAAGNWGGAITVTQSLAQTRGGVWMKRPKTDDSEGTVALLELTANALVQHRARQAEARLRAGRFWHDHDLVCPADDGQPWSPNAFTHAFRDLMARLPELPRVTFHDLRHSHASMLIALGVHMKVISRRLRHSSIGITMDLYGHLLPGVDEDAARQANDAFQARLRDPKAG